MTGTSMAAGDRRRGALAARLSAARRTAARAAAAIPARPATDGPAPLSPTQSRLWFLSQLDDVAAYNVPAAVRLRGPLDVPALLGAVRDLADRHEVLRSLITEAGAIPVDADRVPIVVEELADPGALARRLQEELTRPFALDVEPPTRVLLLRLGRAADDRAGGNPNGVTGEHADEHVLMLNVHHIAFDAWSRNLALAELAALYAARRGEAEPPPPPQVQYADYAAWLSGRPDGDVDWWIERLSGLEPVLDLPVDRPRPSIADWSGAAVGLRLSPSLTARVREVAADTGCTPFMVLLAAWQELLGRISGTDDVPVGVPEAGRLHPDTARMLGCFVNTLVLRGDRSGEPTVRALLARTKDAVLDALTHRDVPFERIVERLHPERGLATTPIFQVMLNVLDDPPQELRFPGLVSERVDIPPRTSKYDLNLSFSNEGDEYDGELVYRTDLFDESTARRMTAWYLNLLEGMLDDLDAPAAAVPLEPVTGPVAVGPRIRMDLSRPLHEVIDDQVRRTPEATAVVDASGSLTYREVDRLAWRLARHLAAAGVRPDQPVGVLTERHAGLVPAILGVLRAGGAYLPMEPAYPDDRLAFMLETAGARVVLADRRHAGRVPGALALPDLLATGPDDPDESLRNVVTPGDLAHVIFTSGSTGRPKGAAVEHRSVLHYLHGVAELVPDAYGSYGVISTIASDLVLTCLYGALIRGAAVHLVDQETATDPEAYAARLAARPIDVIKMVPSHLELLAAHGDLAAMLPRRLLILAGEATSWELAERIRTVRPDLEVQIHCGPTEATVSVLGGRVFGGRAVDDAVSAPAAGSGSGSVPLGRPLPGVECHIVDEAGRPLPPGVPGDLWVSGANLARGYLNRPDLTAERFVPDPVSGTTRCYRTGDRVRLNGDGLMEFLGRVDDQVKVRGFRVELGEVKAALQEQPGVGEAAVLPVGEGRARRLAAWVTPASVDVAAVRAGLRERLPDYMVPATITVLDELPLTPLGKVDRARLPMPEEAPATERVAPSTPTEVRIAQVWADVLDLADPADLGVDDDFFSLGGDSFRAVRAVREIDPGLRVIDLFTRPTIRELAAHLDGGDDPAATTGLLHRLAGPRTASRTLICVPYGGGSAAAFRPLAAELARTSPATAVYAVELPGHDPARPDEALLSLSQLADRLIDELSEISGPIALYGHCVGSAAATELAMRLEASGRPVAGVFVGGSFPDARLPGRLSAWWNRKFPAHRWASDRAQRDFLRTLGALDEDFGDTETMLRGLRHDVEQAQAWFSRHLESLAAPGADSPAGPAGDPAADRGGRDGDPGGAPRRLAAPLLCVIGERDRATELYQERYREWGAFATRVALATIPRAGHYFLKHQAGILAELISGSLDRWSSGDLPEPIEEVEVAGSAARRDLRRFYTVAAGQTVSLLGSALTSFALGVWAFQRSGQVSDYALVTMLALLPSLLAAPLGGAVADRVDRRLVMLVCDGISAVATAALVLLLWLGRLEIWQVGIIAGLLSLVTAFHRPAYMAAVAQLVPKPYLMQANGLVNLGTGLGMLVGPLGGAALITAVGLHGVVAVNIATFLFGLGTLLLVRFPDRLFRRLEESFLQAIVGGWRFLIRRRPLMIMIGFFVVENYFGMLALAVTVPAVMSFSDAAGVGLLGAMQGVGAVLGSLIMVFWGGTERRAVGMVGFVIGFGAGVMLIGLRPSLALAATGALLSWVFLTVLNAHWLALIQLKVGLELQGRVLATNQMLAVSMTPLAFLTAPVLADDLFAPLLAPGGALADTVVGDVVGVGPGRGAALLLALCGVLLMLWGALGLWYRPLRLMEDALPDAVAGAEIADDLDAVQEESDALLLAGTGSGR